MGQPRIFRLAARSCSHSFRGRTRGAALRLRIAARVANPFRRLLRRDAVQVGDALVPAMVHYFTHAEVTAELAEGGFDLVDFGLLEYGWAVGLKTPPSLEGRAGMATAGELSQPTPNQPSSSSSVEASS